MLQLYVIVLNSGPLVSDKVDFNDRGSYRGPTPSVSYYEKLIITPKVSKTFSLTGDRNTIIRSQGHWVLTTTPHRHLIVPVHYSVVQIGRFPSLISHVTFLKLLLLFRLMFNQIKNNGGTRSLRFIIVTIS